MPDTNYKVYSHPGGSFENLEYTTELFDKLDMCDTFNCFNINIRSLPKNFVKLRTFFSNTKITFDIISITETWLSNDYDSTFFYLPGYNLFRLDRADGYGGVCFYISDKYEASILNLPSIKFCEMLNAQIIINNTRIILSVLYRPPSCNFKNFIDELDVHLNHTELSFGNRDTKRLIMGDFNIDIKYTNQDLEFRSTQANLFLNTMSNFNLQPIITQTLTHIKDYTMNSLIDNFFIDINNPVTISGTITLDISDHLPIFCAIKPGFFYGKNLQKDNNNINSNQNNCQNKIPIIDYDSVTNDLLKYNWQLINWDDDVNLTTPLMTSIIQSAIKKHTSVVKRKFRYKISNLPWINVNILKLIKEKEEVFHKLKKLILEKEIFQGLP